MSAESYLKRGVSPTKEDVHKAIAGQSKGLFPGAFCKIIDDSIGDKEYCTIMHADGAGTKSTLAYIMYKEQGDSGCFQGISQDSIVMNIDDCICVGATDGFVVSNTIGRNAHRVDGKVLKEVIDGYQNFADTMTRYGVNIVLTGGETADVGDLVATIIVDSTVFVRMRKSDVIDCSNIRSGDVIVGLSSTGKAVYEKAENSGIGSNGLTAARHMLLSKYYADKYPETYSNTIEKSNVYSGKYRYEDRIPGSTLTVGEALLSPTRTYAPVIKDVLDNFRLSVRGIVHCSGGGQVKCRSFGKGLHFVKNSLFETPPLFAAIQESGNVPWKEMYQIFNMGHRMELYCDKSVAQEIIEISKNYGIDSKIIGYVEASGTDENKVTIKTKTDTFVY